MNTIKIEKKNVKMVAHRGVRGIEPENSNASFLAAGNRSYYGIETDIHVTADGKIIVIHDDETGRVADRNIPVEGSTFEELRALRLKGVDSVPREDLLLPLLTDYLEICLRYEKIGFLELKNAMSREDIAKIIDIIKEKNALGNIVFISFDFNNVMCIREMLPEQPVMLLCGFADDNCLAVMKGKNIGIDIYYQTLIDQPDYTRKLVDMGFEINCWTVNEKDVAEKLVEMGVNYITTDILE